MTIFEEFITKVTNGENYHINFEKRDMKIGKQYLIKDGVYDETEKIINTEIVDPLEFIEELYLKYKYSLPSEKTQNIKRNYFKAANVEELSIEQMITGEERKISKAKLEGTFLCFVLAGLLTWNREWGNWFWQSKRDKDLIILRSWIEGDVKK